MCGISGNKAVNILNNSVLEDKGVIILNTVLEDRDWIGEVDPLILVQIKHPPIEVIKEYAFGGTYFRDIYSGVNGKWYRKSWKEFNQLKDIDQKYYCSSYYDFSINKYCVKCGTSFKFWENKSWINKKILFVWFQWCFRYWLGRRSQDVERQINRWKNIISRFRGKDSGSKFDDYSILPKIKQILFN